MTAGNRQQAMDLAKQRWAERYPFDLAEATWTELFETYYPGEILEAISKSVKTHNPTPENVFSSLTYWVDRLAKGRRENTVWPPPDVHQL